MDKSGHIGLDQESTAILNHSYSPDSSTTGYITRPNITVLLATHNGLRWLPEQMASILGQHNVSVTVWVSDDDSHDGTWEWLEEQARHDVRIKILPKSVPFGSAARNFYRLICEAPWQEADYIAFADQDDVWLPDKLSRHASFLEQHGATAVSSNVTAFWPDGRQKLIDKAQPQREWDYIFEAGGPGCTYLMKPALVAQVQSLLLDEHSPVRQCTYHDWLVYAVCRASGGNWYIDPTPSLLYRQHVGNVIGANVGFRQALRRIDKIRSGWHRQEASKILRCILPLNHRQKELNLLLEQLLENGMRTRWGLLKITSQARRKLFDRLALAVLIACGIW